MDLKERVYSVLVVSAAEKFNLSLSGMLPPSLYHPITFLGSVGAASRKLLERKYDLVIINAPLPDELGVHFAAQVSDDVDMCVLLFVKNELYDEVSAKLGMHGVFVLPKPTVTPVVLQSLRILCASREKLRRLEQKNATLEDKMEEIRLVNRAKWILISHLSMSEAEAHRYIEKQAMDRCVTRYDIASDIIRTYQ